MVTYKLTGECHTCHVLQLVDKSLHLLLGRFLLLWNYDRWDGKVDGKQFIHSLYGTYKYVSIC